MTYNVFSGTLNPTHFTPPVVAKRSPISATAEHLLGLGLVFVHLFTFSILFVFWFSLGYFVLVFFCFRCVWFTFFNTKPQDWLGRTSLK